MYNKCKVYFTVRSISKQCDAALKKPNEILNCRDSLVTIPHIDSRTAFFPHASDIALVQVLTFLPKSFATAP